MTQTAAITTLLDAESRFGFIRVEDEQFFPEWCEELPEITAEEKASVDVLRRRYLYHRAFTRRDSHVVAGVTNSGVSRIL